MELGGLWCTSILNSALPPQRHSPNAQPEHQDPVIHMAQNKREKERKRERGKERKREREREREREKERKKERIKFKKLLK